MQNLPTNQRGALMIEILVTIAIVVIGLWGLMSMQARLQLSEMESYQRTQALLLIDDIQSRISANRQYAGAYDTGATLGMGSCDTTTNALATADLSAWCSQLDGASETVPGSNVGAMIGGRGCIEDLGSGEHRVTVVWQGLTPISAPPTDIDCGIGSYNAPAGSDCADAAYAEFCRRYVTSIVKIADLDT
ncbi:MAG: hypothetical protein ABJ084_15440 [Halioglobus sp.]